MTISNSVYLMRVYVGAEELSDYSSIVEGVQVTKRDEPDEMPQEAWGYLSYFDKVSAQMRTLAIDSYRETESRKAITATIIDTGVSTGLVYKFDYITLELYKSVITVKWPNFEQIFDSDEKVQHHFQQLHPYQ